MFFSVLLISVISCKTRFCQESYCSCQTDFLFALRTQNMNNFFFFTPEKEVYVVGSVIWNSLCSLSKDFNIVSLSLFARVLLSITFANSLACKIKINP